jgi:hypothetical protein
MEVNPDQVPIARPRSSSEKLALMWDSFSCFTDDSGSEIEPVEVNG